MISISPSSGGSTHTHQQAVAETPQSRVVSKPVPQSQSRDPRQYQIDQLRKRFSPTETTAPDGSTSFQFKLHPSDPDFPFELAYLDCDLRVPKNYPKQRPVLLIRNKDIPRGFSINIERGWEQLANERTSSTLLALTNALDKNLERFLSEEKAETVKLVAFQGLKDTRHLSRQGGGQEPVSSIPEPEIPAAAPEPKSKPYVPEISYTRDEIAEAKTRRAQEVRQLEARMGRMNMFRRSADGIVFTLAIEPKRRNELTAGLRSVRSLHLIVPLLYPLQDIRIQLNEVDDDEAETVEELFIQRAASHKEMTLMSHVNFLAMNLSNLSKQAQQAREAAEAKASLEQAAQRDTQAKSSETPAAAAASNLDKSHIQVIPRPPEWSLIRGPNESDSDDFDSDDADDGGVEIGQQPPPEVEPTAASDDDAERGTMLSFPSIELYGIELLQVAILGITVKCERCKTVNEITGLKPSIEKTLVCKKCTSQLVAKFRPQLVHEQSTRAGFIDLSGCKVADMLPSTFIPTCAKCSSPGFGLVSVRGETMSNVCRECHGKFSFRIPDVRFLVVTPGSVLPQVGPQRKREKLGLHAGEPLPQKGACEHYRKSYRWFRFSCCNRVHACDKCHDGAEDHINEWANRMICGWCSREQNYAVEACGMCGRSVIGKKGRGFWEGGRGTRDQRLMSRKDPRKYKRLGGTS
ncbi:unnamed protein product [Clonostachys rosea f. rosea IK726]|jgi:uncharacterized CHY-type Zn-finger protein/phage FluMu protein Com|uniref:CHY-type domain-containing protein n=2 Tax=Bionectria ochroleuca TaxID=29856 RepID=A0A0B7K7M7_BIOOC|nr:unnamed protein product [Clonostachys rosea f. rosea IK726]